MRKGKSPYYYLYYKKKKRGSGINQTSTIATKPEAIIAKASPALNVGRPH